jgi:hypothetical protein
MKLNDKDAIRYAVVEILFCDEDCSKTRLVGIGDGNTFFDENFEFDDKVFYYFHDEADFEKAHDPMNSPSMFDFFIKGEYK